MSEIDLGAAEFKKRLCKTLEALLQQFDGMVTRMQTSKARKAAASIATVKSAIRGKPAQRGLWGQALFRALARRWARNDT